MNKRKKIITLIVVITLICTAFGFFQFRRNRSNNISAKTIIVTKENIKSYLNTTGIVKAKNIKDYYGSQLKVTSINFKIGDKVKKGDILMSFDVSELQNAAKQAKIQYDSAILQKQDLLNQNAKMNSKITDLDSEIADVKSKIEQFKLGKNAVTNNYGFINTVSALKDKITNKEKKYSKEAASTLDNNEKDSTIAQTDSTASIGALQQLSKTLTTLEMQRNSIQPISEEKLKQMDNTVALAKIAFESANSRLRYMPENLTADFDGTITALNAATGSIVNPTSAAVTIEDLENLKVVVSLGKSDIDKVKLDQTATIRSNGKEYNGKISFISPSGKKGLSGISMMTNATSNDVTMDAEIELSDSDEDLKAEFDVDIDILLAEKNSVVAVPMEAIKAVKGGRYVVYTVDANGRVYERDVQLGIQSEINAEIIKGINIGERIILNPSTTIRDGITVKLSGKGGSND
ncbi:efflux RND transporter periplasmic adaptor subunit [Clostridium sp. YIM B02505]|uniref:Efflux RND transporter periplasmic adaptor subunit n=1 Tax=Clostridium yunnanense TaxID=2800325 RepID=A0ABS1ER57_9CLOT|nr:efflux RND transporter periplasmic adaptor subunit [Clostridium yunnanense]MBK1811866.1 efflux RND transporter periplasmic adaptor subunit [Clostridium yunnanense]